MAYSRRIMAYKAAHIPGLLLVFVVVALQGSHMMRCEGHGGTKLAPVGADDASKPSGIVPSDDASKVSTTVVRPLLHSIVKLWDFWAATGDTNRPELEFGGGSLEIEVVPEKFFDTSGARSVYNVENQEGQSENDDTMAGEPQLLMPFQKRCKHRTSNGIGNYIDDCWRCDPNWQDRRQQLASCAIGFGRDAQGGKGGELYVVSSNDDDTEDPANGTLRYGVTRAEPLWIIFATNMTIRLEAALKMAGNKTIDGRGAEVHLVGSSQITIEGVSNVIIHGIHIHDIVRVRGKSEGDAIHIKNSRDVWIDHCYLSNAYDGLVDVTTNSTAVTVSNSYFENHNKVMLFGAGPDDDFDRNMRVTVAFNKFGPNLKQRMPRCRYGKFHVANNFYSEGWGSYAIGGSQDPTILSQGNRFVAPNATNKEVTTRIDDGGPTFGGWETWDWTSSGDAFANGAFFTGSGMQNASASNYDGAYSFVPRPASWVPAMTADAGPLNCVPKTAC